MKRFHIRDYMPRSLYGRAALILMVPIITIQLVLSIVFIQRLYEDVTDQMTENVLFELRFLLEQVNTAETVDAANAVTSPLEFPLGINLTLPGIVPTEDSRVWYDLSGRIVIATLREGLPGVTGVDLDSNSRLVFLGLETRHGQMLIDFSRRRVSASNPHQLLVIVIFVSILMTIIAYIFLRNQLRPVRRLARAAEAFGKGRNVPYRASGATEVRAAGAAFLEMRNRIERHIDQRTLMLSGVSHDLRTPLTRMKLELSLMEPSDEVTALNQELEEMELMLDTFLNFARGAAMEEPQDIDPVALARTVVDKYRRAGHDVSLAQDQGQHAVMLRPMAVERALSNLVGNAVRHADRVEVSVTLTANVVRFDVDDNGPGIPPERREEAIRPFARLDEARNQNAGGAGVGLGLAIVADVARQHGGKLSLEQSETLGGLKAVMRIAV
ncbi:MAG: HAMP domain-containing protein [Rhodobacteraceae bacterium]|nr:HAMP domain-containing protein [Paracoccaceae bacterium]